MQILLAAGVVIILAFYLVSSWKEGPVTEEAPLPPGVAVTPENGEVALPGTAAPEAGAEPRPEPEPEPALKPAPAAKPAPAPKPAPAARPAPAPEPSPAAAPAEAAEGRHSLTLTAKDLVWVQVSVDMNEPFDITLREGETVTWRADEGFSLVIGNAGGVDMTFDGKTFTDLGEPGEVMRLELPLGG